MDIRDYIRILRKNWILVVGLALVGVAIASLYSILAPVRYAASAKVFVSTSTSDSASELVQGNSFALSRVNTYISLVDTPSVLAPAAAALGIDVPLGDLADEVSASSPLNTTIIQINAEADAPKLAADLANAVASSLTSTVQDLETVGGGASSPPIKVTLVQQAVVPPSPSSPNVPLNITLGLLIGLALGVGCAVLRQTLDTRIHNEVDVEELTQLPIIGGMVYDAEAKTRPLIVADDPRSIRAESFRALRTNLRFLDVEGRGRTYVITSPIGSEGKSTTSANLAIALADAGHKVLVVDADMRRPRLAQYLGLEGAVGLTDVLAGAASFADVVQRWGKTTLDVLPAGSIPPNPSELIGSARMSTLLAQFEATYEYVIFDGAPLLPVTDSAILAKMVTGAIVVVAAGKTHKNQFKAALAALEYVGAKVSGVVVTMLPATGPDAYYRYGYSYSYYDDGTGRRKKRGAAATES